MPTPPNLKLLNVRENNLKGLNLELPQDRFTAVTGLSGSGKSSLAFGTVYAEGQRRYIETFSSYTRQFFDKVKKPEVDLVENIRPAIAIEQRTRILNSRSTVGSLTDINDYLRLLWSNLAVATCPSCGIELKSWSAERLAPHLIEIISLKNQPDGRGKEGLFLIGTRISLPDEARLAQGVLERLVALGYNRILFSESNQSEPEIIKVDETPDLIGKLIKQREVVLVLERVRSSRIDKKRIREAIEQAYSLGRGSCIVVEYTQQRRNLAVISADSEQINRNSSHHRIFEFTESPTCPSQKLAIQKPRPTLFSFNHPVGACEACKGFGNKLELDLDLIIPDPNKTIRNKCIVCWSSEGTGGEYRELLKFCAKNDIPIDVPWRDLSQAHKKLIISGKTKEFWGIEAWFAWAERKTYKMHMRVLLAKYRSPRPCSECGGMRLKADALAYRLKGLNIADAWSKPIGDLLIWIDELKSSLKDSQEFNKPLKDLFSALEGRLKYLCDLGLPYLTLDRQARTLSGGETQRVSLASALGSDLVSTQFVLDEPSVGLHARDGEKLFAAVSQLHKRGNSVLVVEHDPEFIYESQDVLELGPGSGDTGGSVTYYGAASSWEGINFDKSIPVSDRVSVTTDTGTLKIRGGAARNIKALDLDLPLNRLVCLTGVSGSGKSSLVSQIIKAEWDSSKINGSSVFFPEGFKGVENIALIDQAPLSKTPRANIATYSGIWDVVRDLLADTEQAKSLALTRSAFSFNVNAGRCTACDGAGFIREDMQFLSDVFIPCEVCLGSRFQQAVLDVQYQEKNVAEILKMTVDVALSFFAKKPKIVSSLSVLSKLGLGHITLGHPLSELSGGEAQRLKLVPYLGAVGGGGKNPSVIYEPEDEQCTSRQKSSGSSLLIFDEPTTGLHLKDVENLIRVLRLLRDAGHSVLCVEHNLTLVLSSDWVIDLGPEGGAEGGKLVGCGTPEFMMEYVESHTARYLKAYNERFYRSSPKGKGVTDKRLIKQVGGSEEASQSAQTNTSSTQQLKIEGARVHNLQNIDIEIPLNKVVAFTGVSGSGKSSIAKDIIYAEGQRRYLDCLSPYARQFIKGLERPDIDHISNILPTISVHQHVFQPGSLSTVGTLSEVYNFLRLLFSKIGLQYCPDHPKYAIEAVSAAKLTEVIKSSRAKQLKLLAPVVKMRKGMHQEVFFRAYSSGVSEVRVDGQWGTPFSFGEGLEKSKVHSIDFVIAKFNPQKVDAELIEEAVNQGLALGGGEIIVVEDGDEQVFSSQRACPVCNRGFFKPSPEDLSFHSTRGRCKKCGGTGIGKSGQVCGECHGSRLNAVGRNVRIGKLNIHEACAVTPAVLRGFLESLKFESRVEKIASPILKDLIQKTLTLDEVGLDYLELTRDCATLSGGELQRLRLATAMGSPLTGAMYIFDEPSIGLHPLDNMKVLSKLHDLKERGNSVILIEHDPASILAADSIVEVGPGGGSEGGRIVFNGEIKEFLEDSETLTAKAIRENSCVDVREREGSGAIKISKGSCNNIKELSLDLPLGNLVSVAGVSGAGKSTLVHEILVWTLTRGKEQGDKFVSERGEVTPSQKIDRVLLVDQQPIGATSRSTPASYLKIWDEIRKIFAGTIEAKSNGWGVDFFSYNSGKGRCQECKGLGQIKLEMNFLADARVTCEACGGRRFNDLAESVHFSGLTVSQVLNLTFEEARARFSHHRKIHHPLKLACDLGLGYLTLGQGSNTLSGGESQRLKLVSELSSRPRGHTLYVLDEPTTGLHKLDVARLIKALHEIVDRGNSVVLIEHDLDAINSSDYVVELGPGPGPKGGKIVYSGSPAKLRAAKSAWGEFLRAQTERSPDSVLSYGESLTGAV